MTAAEQRDGDNAWSPWLLLGQLKSLVQQGLGSERERQLSEYPGQVHSQTQRSLTESKKEELTACQVTKGQMLTQAAQPSPLERAKHSFFGNGVVICLGPRTSTKCMI